MVGDKKDKQLMFMKKKEGNGSEGRKKKVKRKKERAPPGLEPGTSCTLSKNHTPRPRSLREPSGISNPFLSISPSIIFTKSLLFS